MSAPTIESARDVLKKFFGYSSFRPGQEEIISSVLDGKDTLVVMPTGGGKSLCYQIPALLLEGTAVVISPLIALMKDQVDTLVRSNVRATFINSALDFRDVMERMEKARHGWYKMIYVSPERFESTVFLEKMKNIRVSLFAVDEAHCISEWGHDFRPSYTKLRSAIEHLSSPQIMALTATATPDVRLDIEQYLGLREPNIFVRGFERPNLSFRVMHGVNKREFIFNECAKGQSGIIYAGTRKTVDELTQLLQMHTIAAMGYHAGLDDDVRKRIQEQYLAGQFSVIVATTAFGMGIDKPDVRFVIHHDMPGSMEQYYQEAGRAGRDGKPGVCTVLYHPNDKSLPEYFIRSSSPTRELIHNVYAVLHQSVSNPVGSIYRELVRITPHAIANQLNNTSEVAVQSALNVLEESGYIRRVNASYAQATLQFLFPPGQMREWLVDEAPDTVAPVAMALLRTIGGEAFFHTTSFDVADVADKAFLSEEVIMYGLGELQRLDVISFSAGNRGSGFALLGDRVNVKSLNLDMKKIEKRTHHQIEKLRAMEHYLTGHGCRRNMILEYFEETDFTSTCGQCDNCSSPLPVLLRFVSDDLFENNKLTILRCVAEVGGKFGRTTVADILRGAKTKRISQFKLYEASMYGKATHIDKNILVEFIDTLIGMGWIAKTDTLHPSIHLTTVGRSKLTGEVKPLSLPRPSEIGEIEIHDHILYEALRESRRKIAGKYNMASHLLCSDSVLRRLTNRMPGSREECLEIEGLGLTTFEKCGKEFLHVIEQYKHERLLVDAMNESREVFPNLSQTLKATFELYAQGYSLPDIAHHQGLSDGTISTHIAEMITKGVAIKIEQFISPVHQAQIKKALAVVKKPDIKRLKEICGDEIGYAELRIMLAVVGKKNKMD